MPNRDAAVSAAAGTISGALAGAPGGPVGIAIGALVGLGSSLIGSIFGDRGDAAENNDPTHLIRASIADGRWIIGTVKAPGVLLDYYETDIPEGARITDVSGSVGLTTSPGIVGHIVIGIAEGTLLGMDRLWVDDIEVPLVRDPGGFWRSDAAGYDERIADIQARLDALGYNPGLGPRAQAELYSPIIFDLVDELAALTAAQGGVDRDRWLYKLAMGEGPGLPIVRMYTDLGGSGRSDPDDRLAGIEDAANWNDARRPQPPERVLGRGRTVVMGRRARMEPGAPEHPGPRYRRPGVQSRVHRLLVFDDPLRADGAGP